MSTTSKDFIVKNGIVVGTTTTTTGLILQGSTSGTATVNADAISASTVLTLPTGTGTLLSTTGGVTPGTSGNLLTSNGSSWVSLTPVKQITVSLSAPGSPAVNDLWYDLN